MNTIVYNKNVIEFLTVSKQYCSFVENAKRFTNKIFVEKIDKILSLLYLKFSLLEDVKTDVDGFPQDFVAEYDYNYYKNIVSDKLGNFDKFINLSLDDSKVDEQVEISECIADIYQDLKNLNENFLSGSEDAMEASLLNCQQNFRDYWGQRCLCVLLCLHEAIYSDEFSTIDEDTFEDEQEQSPENQQNSFYNNFIENYHKQL